MRDIDHDDTILRTFILFVQTAHAVLKYAHCGAKECRLDSLVISVMVLSALTGIGRIYNFSDELQIWRALPMFALGARGYNAGANFRTDKMKIRKEYWDG